MKTTLVLSVSAVVLSVLGAGTIPVAQAAEPVGEPVKARVHVLTRAAP